MTVVETTGLTELERIEWWRRDVLVGLGLERDLAKLVARDHDVDVREVERLVASGCPAGLAVRIVS